MPVVLDLSRVLAGPLADRDAAARLAAGADIVVDNFLPGRLARFGLAPDDLRRTRPDLITATVAGYPRP